MSGIWLIIAGFFGATGVGAGAYGWHSLGENEAVRQIFMMGVDYQMWHALALLGVAWLTARESASNRAATVAGVCFSLGIVLFSGTLYVFAKTGMVPVEGAAPAGGWLMMAGWAVFMWSGWKIMRAD